MINARKHVADPWVGQDTSSTLIMTIHIMLLYATTGYNFSFSKVTAKNLMFSCSEQMQDYS